MLEMWKFGRSPVGSRVPVKIVIAIGKAILLASLLGVTYPAAAVTTQADHISNDKAKWIKICKADIQRFCDEANLKQECLVAHWSKISAECQDVLGSSAGNRTGDGS